MLTTLIGDYMKPTRNEHTGDLLKSKISNDNWNKGFAKIDWSKKPPQRQTTKPELSKCLTMDEYYRKLSEYEEYLSEQGVDPQE